ncbi:MAG: FCD domain-containing protein [Planctomycetes bacterium]|nr:FCD domain-containing protein [Planctomycetota bacterium]MCD7895396.1 FCD domain-containing protein [Planctomycetaceae bacterium]
MAKKTLSHQVEDTLFTVIVREERFARGQKLPNEMDLSKTLGVSRTTLREAVRSLVSQGILEVRRGKGTYIASDLDRYRDGPSFKNLGRVRTRLRDLFEMRLIFEPEIAALASRRASAKEMAEIIRLGRLEEEVIRAGQDRTVPDQRFHQAIVAASHNEFIIDLVPTINEAVDIAIADSGDGRLLSDHTLHDHAQIMDFLQARDATGAKYAMTLHLHHAMRVLNIADDLLNDGAAGSGV